MIYVISIEFLTKFYIMVLWLVGWCFKIIVRDFGTGKRERNNTGVNIINFVY